MVFDRSQSGWERLSENLFCFHDICRAYAVRAGSHAVLIDLASGSILDRLGEIGVDQAVAVLHTHHHRDQCQGDDLAVAAGIPIFVPAHERHLFDGCEIYWSNRQIFNEYNARSTRFSRATSVPVAGVLEDYGRWVSGRSAFTVVPTPGHTLGSVTLLSQIDGRHVAFCGDLVYAPGKVQTLYDVQLDYGDVDGLELLLLSLEGLQRREPDLLCPSHGMVMDPAQPALVQTRTAVRAFWAQMAAGAMPVDELDWVPVTPHLLATAYTSAYSYAVCSESGRALLIDYGGPSLQLFSPARLHKEPGERDRFIEHSLHTLFERHGVDGIDVVLPTHYHDDHICGIPYLQREMGIPCWTLDIMKEVLENPQGEAISCLLPDPVSVDRTFSDGERFRWQEYTFTIHHAPGHAEYHLALFAEIDGHTVGFTGDNVFPYDATCPHAIYRNRLRKDGYHRTASLLMTYQPDILCTGHSFHHNVERRFYEAYQRKAWQMTQHFEALLPGEANYGIEPNWLQLYPYQTVARPGDALQYEVRMLNFLPREVQADLALVLPKGWSSNPRHLILRAGPEAQASAELEVRVPRAADTTWPRQVILAEVILEGQRLGQVTEAVVEWEKQI